MPTDITIAGLIGTDSTWSRLSIQRLRDVQEFSFPGINGVFKSALGDKGAVLQVSGLLRTQGASLAAARNALETVLSSLDSYYTDATELNLYVADASNTAALYGTKRHSSIVLDGIAETGPRRWSVVGAVHWITVPYTLLFRRLV